MQQATDIERAEFARRTESDGHAFYQMASRKTGHKLARSAFELLAKEELRHVAIIDALEGKLRGEGEVEDVSPHERAELEFSLKSIYENATDEAIEGELDPAEAYAKAIELEKKITALYTEYTKEAESDEAKRLFDALRREEQNHLSLLEDMHAYLTKPEEWFIDRDGIMLDGG